MNFDFENVKTAILGVGIDTDTTAKREDRNTPDGYREGEYYCIATDKNLQKALVEMATSSWKSMQKVTKKPSWYEPSEKYSSNEHICLELNNPLAETIRSVHDSTNIPLDQSALDNIEKLFCYFAQFTDSKGNKLTALRKASEFKGLVMQKNRLIRVIDDTMKFVEDMVFKLDKDFDMLADDKELHILRPSSFEYIGKLKDEILKAVSTNISTLKQNLSFVEFDRIEQYAENHPRAARYLASIRSRQDIANINRKRLISACKDTGVDVNTDRNGKIIVNDKNMMGFLEVLDRRRYTVDLSNSPRKVPRHEQNKNQLKENNMSSISYTEDILVQTTIADYLQNNLGWQSVYAFNNEDFGPDSLLGRASDHEVVLTRFLREALVKLNPDLPDDAYEAAIRKPGSRIRLPHHNCRQPREIQNDKGRRANHLSKRRRQTTKRTVARD